MYYEIFKFEVETLPERKRCFEKRCKGTHYFDNFQIFTEKYHVFAHLFVPLALPKVLSFGKPQNNLGFRSLICNFAPK